MSSPLCTCVFFARNPQAAQIAWKARQKFEDGTSADWIGIVGDRRPTSIDNNAKLAPHMSHKVTLTGDVMDTKGTKIIHATDLKMISK